MSCSDPVATPRDGASSGHDHALVADLGPDSVPLEDLRPPDRAVVDAPAPDLVAVPDLLVADTQPAADAAPLKPSSWSFIAGGPKSDAARALSPAPAGGTYLGADFRGAMTLSGVTHKAQGADILILLLDASGKVTWQKSYGGPSDDAVESLSFAAGGLSVTGAFQGSIDFGKKLAAVTKGSEAYVARLDAQGNHIWSRTLGSASTYSYSSGRSVIVDSQGNTFVAGTYFGAVDLGKGPESYSGKGQEAFLAKYDAKGNLVFGKVFGSTINAIATGLAIDSKGAIYLVGRFSGKLSFGGTTMTGYGGGDAFVAKFSSSGKHLWSERYGSNFTSKVTSVAVDAKDNPLIAGSFRGTISFGGKTFSASFKDDVFMAKLDSQGNHIWSRSYGSGEYDYATRIALDAKGDVYFVGMFSNPVDFGAGLLIPASTNNMDIVIGRYDGATGAAVWTTRLGGQGQEYVCDCSVAGSKVMVAGSASSGIDFGKGPVTTNGMDLFVAHYPLN
jgi:hypothetical protein